MASSQEQIAQLLAKHGNTLETFWKEEISHDIHQLTKAEAGQLLAAADVDTIRNRIFTAKEKVHTTAFSKTTNPTEQSKNRN